ncbi:cation diffusion facilitator family transporter [Halococcus hamelinensis]|uniref:Cation diffusion facilitator family transporter n=1 Tax=Halococcus hamelinensis 100A6 TaxID=1132509 RepID=M0LV51_9EURY|nr:cation diffusion facilitator family transporter [Halococcus hamelinensis]EMA36259.1 cation diffusion facilitator family transporter [Halococcus hamelinensis 100A6]
MSNGSSHASGSSADGGVGHDDHGHDHSHGHGHGDDASTRTLALVAVINVVGFVAELAGGLLFGSVALLSDAVHMLFDALAYVMAFAASYVATNAETSDRWSFGLHRLEPLSAFVNGALLVPMVGFIVYEAVQRFLDPVGIATGPTLLIAGFGLAVNLGSVLVLEGGEMSLNERGAFYHLLGDAGGSVAVIVSVLAVEYSGVNVIDPITAGLIALVVLWSAGKLLRGSGAIFLHRTPFDSDEVRAAIAEVDGVTRVTDLHAWQVCSQITVATTHVETATGDVERESVTRRVHDVLAEAGVDHATVECCPEDTHHPHLTAHDH